MLLRLSLYFEHSTGGELNNKILGFAIFQNVRAATSIDLSPHLNLTDFNILGKPVVYDYLSAGFLTCVIFKLSSCQMVGS